MNVSSFILKIVAIIGMTCNHIANVFAADIAAAGPAGEIILVALYSLGGLTFPIMAFLLTEGYAHTSNVAKYAQRLLLFGLVAQIPYSLLWGAVGNVLFTLLISLGILYANDHCARRRTFWLVAGAGLIISYWCDWGVIGPIMVYLFSSMRGKGAHGITTTMIVPYAASGLPALLNLIAQYVEGRALVGSGIGTMTLMAWCNTGYAFFGFSLATLLMMGYKGRRGRSLKWLFYVYYPLHLMVIWIVDAFIL